MKHARRVQVNVVLGRRDNHACRDRRGRRPRLRPASPRPTGSGPRLGVLGMRERMSAWWAGPWIDSAAGEGTVVIAPHPLGRSTGGGRPWRLSYASSWPTTTTSSARAAGPDRRPGRHGGRRRGGRRQAACRRAASSGPTCRHGRLDARPGRRRGHRADSGSVPGRQGAGADRPRGQGLPPAAARGGRLGLRAEAGGGRRADPRHPHRRRAAASTSTPALAGKVLGGLVGPSRGRGTARGATP